MAGHYPFGNWTPWCFGFAIAWIGGAGFRLQIRLTHRLQAAQAELARQEAEGERHRLAREVHDLIAHSLAVSMLHLTGARLALQADEKAEALEALEEAERAGRSAMTEIHRTVGLLGPGEDKEMPPATPSGADIPKLVEDFRLAGLPVDHHLSGDLSAVSLSAGLAAYRIVEESLANAVKHSHGSPVSVTVAANGETVSVRVANPVAARTGPHLVWSREGRMGSGNGVIGMRERAVALGGLLSAGEVDGCWTVEAVIPSSEPAQ
jgi:signal transduction histidine kinase